MTMLAEDITDDALMTAAAAGDERAFRRLVDRHAGALRACAWRLTGNSADMDDLVQETFTRAFQIAPRWRNEGVKFTTWAYRVLTNLAIDAARRRKTRGETAMDLVPEPMDEQNDGALLDARLETRGRNGALREAIRALPERQRQAVVLTYGSGLANAEVARILGVSIEAVEAALSRARAALKGQMREQGFLETPKREARA